MVGCAKASEANSFLLYDIPPEKTCDLERRALQARKGQVMAPFIIGI
jgi:hypothetical protein